MTITLAEVAQSPSPGELITLFRLDLTPINGTTLYLTQGIIGDTFVEFGGIHYTPYDISLSDFEVNAGGSLPTPKMSIANAEVDSFIQTLINTYGDLVGCEIRRVRTYRSFLDDGAHPDPSAYLGPDVFRIERKSDENPNFVEYELSAAIDQEGKMLPGEIVIRDTCTLRYRRYDPTDPNAAGDGFVYATISPCPYAGASYFTPLGQTTTNVNDSCGLKLSDCRLRFGASAPLPFGGFPGAARVHG